MALEHTGGGTVTESEIGDDGAAYSVEVRLADGSQVEVNLEAREALRSSAAPQMTTEPAASMRTATPRKATDKRPNTWVLGSPHRDRARASDRPRTEHAR